MGPDLASLRLMLGDVQRTIDAQIATGDLLDQKAARVMGWNGLLAGLALTAASLATPRAPPASARPAIVVAVFALTVLLMSTFLAIRTSRVRSYFIGIEPATLASALLYDMGESAHLERSIVTYGEAHRLNQVSLDAMAPDFQWALAAHFMAIVAAAFAIVLFIWLAGRW